MKNKKTGYFAKLALSVLRGMRMHKNPGGLWERRDGKRDWGNVSEHCLVVVARVDALGDMLRLSTRTKRELKLGACLHDYHKKHEVLAMKASVHAGGDGMDVSNTADGAGAMKLRAAGWSDSIVEIATGCGGKPPEVFAMDDVLEKEFWDDHDLARLILHYVDGYTCDSNWVQPAVEREDGTRMNEVDRRTAKNLTNSTYQKQNLRLVPFFDELPKFRGRGAIENEGIVCHMIEQRLSAVIADANKGVAIDPLDIPEMVDNVIRERMEAL